MGKDDTAVTLDWGGMIISAILIVVGAAAIWDTTTMSDPDSFVFPRAVAIAMMLLSAIYIIRQLIRPGVGENSEAGTMGGSAYRRVGLVIAMIGSALVMPWVGFLVSGLFTFCSIMLLAMFDEWTTKRKIAYPLIGIVIVAGFYLLFAELLSVPLPVGSLFD